MPKMQEIQMTQSPNKTELNAGEMPEEILIYMGYASGQPQILRAGQNLNGAVKFIRADLVEKMNPKVLEDAATREDAEMVETLKEGTSPRLEETSSTSLPVINDAGLTNDYNERLHKCVMRFGAEFRSMQECRNFEGDVLRIVEEKAINNIPIDDKIIHGMACAYEEERARYLGGIAKYPANGDAFIGCMKKALINHAVKGEKVAEVTEEDLTTAYSPTPVFKEAFIQIVRWLQDKYPAGIKIVDGGA